MLSFTVPYCPIRIESFFFTAICYGSVVWLLFLYIHLRVGELEKNVLCKFGYVWIGGLGRVVKMIGRKNILLKVDSWGEDQNFEQ